MRWYDKDGKIVEEIKGKNGKMRPPTVRDARENGYFPSVTTILDQMSKPALTQYFINEALSVAYDNKGILKKPKDQAIAILAKKAKEDGGNAADFGTLLHDHVERFLKAKEGEIIEMQGDVKQFVEPVFEYIIANGIKGTSEQALIINCEGGRKVAGTVDNHDDEVIRDFKTQRTKDGKFTCYPSWLWQISGYNLNLKKPKGEIIAISSTEPGLIKKFEFTKEDLEKGTRIFNLLVELFYLTKGI